MSRGKAVSARGLFRATGNRPRARAERQLDGTYAKVDTPAERDAEDFYPTPVEPIRALLSYEREALRCHGLPVWEPACGDGCMAREIEEAGYRVFKSDLIDRGCGAAIADFYDFKEPPFGVGAIITNPPFNECNARDGGGRWIWHALGELRIPYMALLLSWNWPGAGGPARLWQEHTPSVVYLMRWKIDFTGQGAPPMLNAWFVWDRLRPPREAGVSELRMMDRVDARQGTLL